MSRKKLTPTRPRTRKPGLGGAESRADALRKGDRRGAKKDSPKRVPKMLKSRSGRIIEHTESSRSRDKSLGRVDSSVAAEKALRESPLPKNKLGIWEKLQASDEEFRKKAQ